MNLTSLQDFLHFDVVCTEAAVVLEVVGVVKKRSTQREEKFLKATTENVRKKINLAQQGESTETVISNS